MSEYGLRCWDADGNITFNNEVRTIRRTRALLIKAGQTGTIELADLNGGAASVMFGTARYSPGYDYSGAFPPVEQMPYAVVSGSTVTWEAGAVDCWMYVLEYS